MKLPHRRQFLHLAAGAASLPVVSRIARAQAYPMRPITMIVPYPAGALIDATARVLADRMRRSLGQPINIENISGAAATSVPAAPLEQTRTAIPLKSETTARTSRMALSIRFHTTF